MKKDTDNVLAYNMLNTLCPMHAILSDTGHILNAGPTFHKLHPSGDATGIRLLEFLELKRPRTVKSMQEFCRVAGEKLHFQMRNGARTELKGILSIMPENAPLGMAGGAILNLSFGISVVDAVYDYALTSADFAATDLTVEMLYLVEAKSAAMDASRKLNQRLQGAKLAAEEQAYTDTLTGLKNRRALDVVLNRLITTEQDFALMHLDLDFFKAVNDTLGHAAGDHVLQAAADQMRKAIRENDTIIRTGGDEFVLIFSHLTSHKKCAAIATNLIAALEEPIPFNGHDCRISASIGISLSCDQVTPTIDQLMENSDIALYAAKENGRACYVIHDPSAPPSGTIAQVS